MKRPSTRPLLLGVFSVAGILAAAGCGTGGYFSAGNASNGQTLFAQKCGSCHTLKGAGTTGQVGPNLDLAFGYLRQQGFKEETIRQIVADQIELAQFQMPANIVTGKDRTDVATYVARVAGTDVNALASTPAPTATGVQEQSGARAETPAPGAGTSGGTASSGADAAKVAAGKQVFTSAGCAACHTLKDAGATGQVGPNLDTLKPAKDRVVKQVTNGGKVMQSFKGQLSADQIDAVATYVSTVAGK